MKKSLTLLFIALHFALNLFAQWQNIPVPDGGTAFCVQEENETVYALAYGGLYESTDEGKHWIALGPGLRGMYKFRVSKGIFYGYVSSSNELYKSTDKAKTWKKVFEMGAPERINDFWANGNNLIVLSSQKIYYSSDHGESWTTSNSDILGFDLEKLCSTPTECFAWGPSNIFRTSDGGANWEKVSSSEEAFLSVGTVDQKIFVLYHEAKRIVMSTDGLRSWQTIETDKMWTGPYYGQFMECNIKGKGDFIVLFFPRTYPGSSRLSYSRDGGLTWNVLYLDGSPDLPLQLSDLLLVKEHFLMQGAELYRSDHNMKNIETAYSGLKGHYINYLNPVGEKLYANTLYYVASTDNKGKNWEALTRKKYYYSGIEEVNIQVNNNMILLKLSDSTYQYSVDNGKSWGFYKANKWEKIVLTDNKIWAYNEGNKYFHRLDNGFKIERLFHIANISNDYQIKNFTTRGSYLYFTLYESKTGNSLDHIVLNEDLKVVLRTPASPCLLTQFLSIPAPVFDGNNMIDFCLQTAYYYGTNNQAWEKYYPVNWKDGTNFLQNPIVAIAQENGVHFIAVQNKGIFYTNDQSGRFYPIEPALPSVDVTAMTLKDNKLWVATQDAKIYSLDLQLASPIDKTPIALQLSPNPSDGHMTLTSDLFLTEYSPFSLHDATGKMVAERELPPGNRWEMDFLLPPGVYFLRLLTQNGVVGKKWVLR